MCFDVPKVVRSPRCDHGHDEEYRNGREVKIHILEGYIRTPEWFRSFRMSFGVPGVTGTPREVIGPHGPKWWKRRGGQGAAARPSPPKSELDKEGGAPPFLVLFGLKGRGHASCLGRPLSLSTKAQQGPLVPGGVPVTPGTPIYIR